MIDIQRFLEAQDYWIDTVKGELKSKQKDSHWIWFIFPQLKGLGTSPMSEYYGLNSVKDAREYYKNKQLRKNLNDCLSIIYKYKNKEEVVSCLGKLDTMKLHSCVSLFYLATKKNIFKRFVKKFFNSILDKKTILLLEIGVQ